jgi:hypothetical protein
VAEFIERRDGIACDPESVCLSGGASEAIRVCSKYLIKFNPIFAECFEIICASRWTKEGRNNGAHSPISTLFCLNRRIQFGPSWLFPRRTKQLGIGYGLNY